MQRVCGLVSGGGGCSPRGKHRVWCLAKAPGRGREGGTPHVNSAGVRSWRPHSALAGRSCTATSSTEKALSPPRSCGHGVRPSATRGASLGRGRREEGQEGEEGEGTPSRFPAWESCHTRHVPSDTDTHRCWLVSQKDKSDKVCARAVAPLAQRGVFPPCPPPLLCVFSSWPLTPTHSASRTR